MSTPRVPPFLTNPIGGDCPSDLEKAFRRDQPSRLTFGKTVLGVCQFRMDSQQPRLDFFLQGFKQGRIIFTAENCDISIYFHQSDAENAIQQYRHALQEWPKDDQELIVFKIVPSRRPVMPATVRTKPSDKDVASDWQNLGSADLDWEGKTVMIWMARPKKLREETVKLVSWMRNYIAIVRNDGNPESHWFSQRNKVNEETHRRPPMPWLKDDKDRCLELVPRDPFFIDDRDRRGYLLDGIENERAEQLKLIYSVFSLAKIHEAVFVKKEAAKWFVHVKVSGEIKPQVTEMTKIQFALYQKSPLAKRDMKYTATVINDDSDNNGDFTMVLNTVKGDSELPQTGRPVPIVAITHANVSPVDAQLNWTDQVSRITVFGDDPKNEKRGFSLKKTVLAHGREMDPHGHGFFALDMRQHSALEASVKELRIKHILEKATLDPFQLEAFTKSTTAIPGGVMLIQGPPGTGKTKTAVPIVLSHAAIGLKVLIAAGSNKAVDNLTAAVFACLKGDVELRRWCGQLIRFRSPSWQMCVIRKDSKAQTLVHSSADTSTLDQNMQKCQLYTLVEGFAARQENENDQWCKQWRRLLKQFRDNGLSGGENRNLKAATERIMGRVLQLPQTRIVATTLSCAAHEILLLNFEPDVLVCDESGQCLEGDHMIALTLASLKAVILIGDHQQLPPTVISKSSGNEFARYVERSLLSRLGDAGYPLAQLRTNYRCHSSIMELFNRVVYKSLLVVGPHNDDMERVGRAWDEFTKSRHYFKAQSVAGARRMFISVSGMAEKKPGETSWINRHQVRVLIDMLRSLYGFQAPFGDKVKPEDVMIIAPYRAQRNLVKNAFREERLSCKDILTIDAAQGQEAPMVFLLMTKPSGNSKSLGFNADRNRLNVAISRAQKVFVIIGNLQGWDRQVQDWMNKEGKAKFLGELLHDVVAKGNVLTYFNTNTIAATARVQEDNNENVGERHQLKYWPGMRVKRDSMGSRVQVRPTTPPNAPRPFPAQSRERQRSPLPQYSPERGLVASSRLQSPRAGEQERHRLPPRPPTRAPYASQIQQSSSVEPADRTEANLLLRLSELQVTIHSQEVSQAAAEANRARAEYEVTRRRLEMYRQDRQSQRERSQSPRKDPSG